MRRMGQPGSDRWPATPTVSSIRIELDETALVRPSNAPLARGAGSAGSTTIAERPLEVQRRRQSEADETSTEDDHVRPVHGIALRRAAQ